MTNYQVLMADQREGPSWLPCFLKAKYFSSCKLHAFERNHFCIDCISGPLCPAGLHDHTQHRTLQVRRASHFDAVRIADIQKLVDVTQIQTYVINSAKIVFLLPRPQQKTAKELAKACKSCGRSLADPVGYCSIGCKLVGVRKNLSNEGLSLTLYGENAYNYPTFIKRQTVMASPGDSCSEDWLPLREAKEMSDYMVRKKPRKLVFSEMGKENKAIFDNVMSVRHNYNNSEIENMDSPPAPSTPQSREWENLRGDHKRKGTPHRAPFA